MTTNDPYASTHLRHAALSWLGDDPDPQTRSELASVLARGDVDALRELFSEPLVFGTAGLRGPLGPGPARMNRVVVGRTAIGLARFLLRDTKRPTVVIGFDARRNSERFARDTAELMQGQGVTALLMPRALPTPSLAFAVRHLQADAGVMVTASHNPADDNGYKVYLGGSGLGAQIAPPYDTLILDEVNKVDGLLDAPRSDAYTIIDESVVDAYLARVHTLVPDGPRDITVVYTPLHGVGGHTFSRVLDSAGFRDVHLVAEQYEPDATFPTAPRPNPEEPGTLDLAQALAARVGADVIIASDPDADRMAVVIPLNLSRTSWRRLTGDEVGALLAEFLLEEGMLGDGQLVSTVVSSTLLGRIAEYHGRKHTRTLTGFKWICRVPDMIFGYEEALGYCLDPLAVRDKDGISAALVILHAVASWQSRGQSVQDRLDELARRFGAYHTAQRTVPVASPAESIALLARLLAEPALLEGAVMQPQDMRLSEPAFDGVRFTLSDDSWLLVRPSGTEPKVKVYVEVVQPVDAQGSGQAAEYAAQRASRLLDELVARLAPA
jgi:phosphomannomutase